MHPEKTNISLAIWFWEFIMETDWCVIKVPIKGNVGSIKFDPLREIKIQSVWNKVSESLPHNGKKWLFMVVELLFFYRYRDHTSNRNISWC